MRHHTLAPLTVLSLAAAPTMAAFQTLAGGTAQTSGSYYIGGIYDPFTISQKQTQDAVWSPSGTGVNLAAFGTQTIRQVIRPGNSRIDQPITWYSQAQAAAYGSAEPGKLHAHGAASALMNPTTQSLVYEDTVTHQIKQETFVHPLHAVAQAQIQVGWQDTITITSATLAPGTWVNVNLKAVLDSTITNPNNTPNNGVSTTFTISAPSGSTSLQVVGTTSSDTAERTRLWSFKVGETVTLKAVMNLGVFAWAGYNINYGGLTVPSDSVSVDASNTGHYYFDLAPGVDAAVVSESGYNYSVTAPVPEPAGLGVALLAGGIALTSRRRRPTVAAA